MSVFELFVLSAALGADLFSVAIPLGMNRIRLRLIAYASLVFALFHVAMILGGYSIGHWLGSVVDHVGAYHINWPAAAVQDWASAAGAFILAWLAGHMIWNGLTEKATERKGSSLLTGLPLIAIAVSVSLDALAAGVCMGMMDVDLVLLSLILGLVIFCVAVLGLVLGRRVGRIIGRRAEMIGGAVLLVLAVHVFWTAIST